MKVLALAGGVGGAKLCLGLARALPSDALRIVVNTGDDEDFYGLRVCPDMDTVMYTLAGMSNTETGWGIAGESFTTLSALERIGQDPWFMLGDQDMATHIVRSDILRRGGTLSQATDYLRRWLGVERPIIPMSDDRVRTMVETDAGTLPFQTYFVKLRCEPRVSDIRFAGADGAALSPGFSESLDECDVLVVCPSNPYLSVAPILSVPGVRERIEAFEGVRVAVSPIVGGEALKGPAAKLLEEMGEDVSCVGVARQYAGLCDIFVLDEVDRHLADEVSALGMEALVLDTIMTTDEDKTRLAREIAAAASGRDAE